MINQSSVCNIINKNIAQSFNTVSNSNLTILMTNVQKKIQDLLNISNIIYTECAAINISQGLIKLNSNLNAVDTSESIDKGAKYSKFINEEGKMTQVIKRNVKTGSGIDKGMEHKDITQSLIQMEIILTEIRMMITNENVFVKIGAYVDDKQTQIHTATISRIDLLKCSKHINLLSRSAGKTAQEVHANTKAILNFVNQADRHSRVYDQYKSVYGYGPEYDFGYDTIVNKNTDEFWQFIKEGPQKGGPLVSGSHKNDSKKVFAFPEGFNEIDKNARIFELYNSFRDTAGLNVVYKEYKSIFKNNNHTAKQSQSWNNAWMVYYKERTRTTFDSDANYKSGDAASSIESKFGLSTNSLFTARTVANQTAFLVDLFSNQDLSSQEKLLELYHLYYNKEDFQNLLEYLKNDIIYKKIIEKNYSHLTI